MSDSGAASGSPSQFQFVLFGGTDQNVQNAANLVQANRMVRLCGLDGGTQCAAGGQLLTFWRNRVLSDFSNRTLNPGISDALTFIDNFFASGMEGTHGVTGWDWKQFGDDYKKQTGRVFSPILLTQGADWVISQMSLYDQTGNYDRFSQAMEKIIPNDGSSWFSQYTTTSDGVAVAASYSGMCAHLGLSLLDVYDQDLPAQSPDGKDAPMPIPAPTGTSNRRRLLEQLDNPNLVQMSDWVSRLKGYSKKGPDGHESTVPGQFVCNPIQIYADFWSRFTNAVYDADFYGFYGNYLTIQYKVSAFICSNKPTQGWQGVGDWYSPASKPVPAAVTEGIVLNKSTNPFTLQIAGATINGAHWGQGGTTGAYGSKSITPALVWDTQDGANDSSGWLDFIMITDPSTDHNYIGSRLMGVIEVKKQDSESMQWNGISWEWPTSTVDTAATGNVLFTREGKSGFGYFDAAVQLSTADGGVSYITNDPVVFSDGEGVSDPVAVTAHTNGPKGNVAAGKITKVVEQPQGHAAVNLVFSRQDTRGDLHIPRGTELITKEAILFRLYADVYIFDGNKSTKGNPTPAVAVAVQPGSQGAVGANSITQFARPTTAPQGVQVTNPKAATGGVVGQLSVTNSEPINNGASLSADTALLLVMADNREPPSVPPGAPSQFNNDADAWLAKHPLASMLVFVGATMALGMLWGVVKYFMPQRWKERLESPFRRARNRLNEWANGDNGVQNVAEPQDNPPSFRGSGGQDYAAQIDERGGSVRRVIRNEEQRDEDAERDGTEPEAREPL